MNARGAMELVVASIGLSLGILNQQMFSIIVVVAIATSFMAPVGLRLTMRRVLMTRDESDRLLAEQSRGVFNLEAPPDSGADRRRPERAVRGAGSPMRSRSAALTR